MRFDWRMRDGVASRANFALVLSFLLVFPLILRFTGALEVADISAQSPEHTAAFLKFCTIMVVFLWSIFLITLAGIRNRGAITSWQMIGREWNGATTVAVHLGVAVLAFATMAVIGNVSSVVLGPFQHDSKAFQSIVAHTPVEAIAFLVLALSAGFAEEFVFRGYVQRQFRALFGSGILASCAQIAIFAYGHTYQGWPRLIPVMLIGLVLTLTARWCRSLVPGMVAHGCGDALVSLMFFVKHL